MGGHVLRLLLSDPAYERVAVLGRRPTGHRHPKLTGHVAPLDRMAEHAGAFAVDDVFCCLGTTLRTAGSREAFSAVDLDAVALSARLAAEQGATRYLLVTAAGAGVRSPFFYSRVKGQAEEAVTALPFRSTVILRPSQLLGERGERRPVEAVAQRVMAALGPAFVGPLRRYRAIDAPVVARAMVRLAKQAPRGVRVVESDEIQEIGGA
ncbi:MAG: Nucleoside-diphosphate-sugar epimerases [uncultured Gemmatimonadetes bacterium]|uniref:Nucleoside-diphosphate-sugar epimerases n=1 Tax=uncultured Gemmatimonadota bacterium TaxID=203437 RepID=A0A6J4LT79_9BACT|nr:MAG: Nucleoside-diphosphate-sugar epimerases [uncultured Gemmatimonadota bacterium]